MDLVHLHAFSTTQTGFILAYTCLRCGTTRTYSCASSSYQGEMYRSLIGDMIGDSVMLQISLSMRDRGRKRMRRWLTLKTTGLAWHRDDTDVLADHLQPVRSLLEFQPIFAFFRGTRPARGVTIDMAAQVQCSHQPQPPSRCTTTQQLHVQEILTAHQISTAPDHLIDDDLHWAVVTSSFSLFSPDFLFYFFSILAPYETSRCALFVA